ncbi:LOW QUALITY PROTEIN: receptor-type tyrosine-protein phosphatase eta-like [Onychostoma macrolepis]|uniref:LOW QUALITY PROTEIN: receptor-type tyrosine-protein phosphatase eta-like n=1 Tax=Onychostoma macrolepis TaxID=369639 RepID=UPI002729B611|nr:LOW QUALITY PROTEIN: receptor-type tyrosine-protein phosphatase eta-like [Onychostoma macrolepis]
MGCLSIKTVCKGTALLIFVLLLGLNAQTSVTDVLAASDTTSYSLTESQTSVPTNVLAASDTTSSSLTESQTSVPTTAPATTSSPSAESQTSAPSTASTTTSSPSTETSAPSRPNAIENLTVTEISTSFVLLKWEKQLKMGSSFKVQWTADETYGNVTVTVTNVTINGLTAGVNYKFCVTVVAADTSTESNSVCISAWTKPDVIRDLRVTNITTSSVFLRWNEPGGKRDFFKIQWTDDKTNKTTTNTSYNITDLTAGVNYTFCITAVAANQSTEGEPVCISNYTKPDVIRNLTVNNITTSSVFLTWNEPGGKRDFFKIQWTDDKTNRNSTTNTFYNITDLTAGVSYKFCITAVAADQSTEGEPVCISNYTKPDVIRNLTVNNITTSSVFLTWNEPGGKRDFFKIQWTDDKTNRNSTTNTFYNITDLTAGVSYKFCITAVAADQSTEGEPVCISNYTKPDVIRNLTVNNITTSSVFLTWNEPGGKRDFFKIQWTDDKTNRNSTTNTFYNITDLTAGVSYKFCITAVAADQSTEGEPVCISNYTKPDVIRNLTVNNITTSSVFLTWNEPGGKRDFFKIQWTDDKTNRNSTTNTFYNITDLTAGVSYKFCITAVAADQSTEGEPVCISNYTKPDVIRNLTVNNITTSSVFLTWNEPGGKRDFFKIQWTDDKTNRNSTTNTFYNITDLTAGVSYKFCITAVAADQSTEGETVCISNYTKPDVIRNLIVNNITTSSVFLRWNEPGGKRDFFKIQWTDDKTNRNSTTNTSYNITDLTAGVSYKFCITAVAADQSTEGEPVCISNYTKPDVIRNLTVNNITTSSVFLTWNEPAGNRDFFKLRWTDDKTNETSDTFYNITDLTAGVNYTFCITAVAADQSTEGEPVCISNYTKPDVIRNLTVNNITTSSVFLTWNEPAGNRDFFKLRWTDDKTNETSDTFYNIIDLTAGVNYTFCITAVAADQSTEGEPVCISNYTKPDVITNLRVTNITTSSVFLRWNEPDGNRSFFKLQRTDDNTNKTTTYTSYNVTGLNAGVNYTFCITAVAADQSTEGEPVCISQFTKPDVIRNLRVTNITTSSVFLRWDEPDGNRSFFKLQRTDDNTNKTTTYTSYNITGLTAGVNYTFCITAVAADQSTEGETVCISQFTKPDVIRNLRVTNITTSSVFLRWDEPDGNRSFFKLQRTDDKTNKTTTNTSYNITDLTAGVNYTFCITAVAADKSTEGETVCISQFTKPDVIRNLRVTNITTSSVFLRWNEPDGNRSFFKLQRTDDKTNKTTTNTSYNITDLTAGVNYTFCITAVAADKSTEGETVCISQFTKPDVIRNLRVTNITTSSVFLTWTEPDGNRSFFKLQRTDDKTNKTTTNTSYNITGLTAGVNYTFCITAVAADKSTEGETVCISQFTKPDVIRNLRVTNITTSSVFLTWTEPDGNRSFFKLQRTDDKTNKTTTNTSYNITGLTAGVNYTFCITAVAADKSTEGETVCISQFTKPDVIRNLRVTNITTSSVFLTWTEPDGNRSFFKLQRTDDKTNKTTTNTSYNITGLTAGVNYTFCITAVAADKSTEGETVCISQFTKPDVIRNLRVTNITTSSVFLTWTEPDGNRSFFKLQRTDDKTNKTTTNTSYNITGLTAGVNYTFCITAVAADKSTEGETVCISQFTKPDVIRNLRVTNITTSSVFLTWTEPDGNRSFFKLQRTDDKTNKTTTNTSYNITGLTAGVNYTFCITAVAADKSTEGETVCISQFTKPDVIRNLRVTNITTSSVFLTWTEPDGNRSFFKLQRTDDKTNKTTTNTSYNITDLTAGVNYTFCITAVAADQSTEGETVCISQFTKPDVIRNLRVTNITTSSVFLRWNEPAGKRNFFKIQWTDDKTNRNSTTNAFYNITDLTAGVNYTFCITAVASDESTEGEPVCISNYIKPDVIRNLTVTDVTASSVLLTWDEPGGKRDCFRIQWTDEKRTNNKETKTINNTSYHITDLTAGVNYTFCITAVASDKSTEGEPVCISHCTISPNKDSEIPVTVGVVLAVICFLIIMTLILFFYSRRQTKQCPDIPVHTISDIALRIEDYEEYFKQKHADSNCGFAVEYEELKTVGTAQSKNTALAIENKPKNRYSNVLPYDASRVKLSMCGSPFDDYINANYIPGYNSRKEFIAAQGPLPVTVNEFWRMIWEKNIYTIVMLTKCNEMGRVKCEKYWPSGTNHYQNNSVTTTSEIELESWTIRDFRIKNVKTAETRYVRQFHFTAWPDHGVPQTTEVLIDFRHLVREHMDQYSRHSPTVVHCSAGVGRTGTFIAIDHLIFQIERDSMVDIYGIVNDMRMHRPLMVQTEEQYVYLHQCAYDIIRSRTGTNVDLIYQNAAALSIYQNVEYQKS